MLGRLNSPADCVSSVPGWEFQPKKPNRKTCYGAWASGFSFFGIDCTSTEPSTGCQGSPSKSAAAARNQQSSSFEDACLCIQRRATVYHFCARGLSPSCQ